MSARWLLAVGIATLGCGDDAPAAAPDDAVGPNVIQRSDPAADLDCRYDDCTAPYRDFEVRNPGLARPATRADVLAAVDAADAQPLPGTLDLAREDLAARIADAAGIARLLEGLDERELVVTTVAEEPAGDARKRRLVFDDPFVGRFPVTVLEPAGDEPAPAIVGLHGHRDDPTVFALLYLGNDLAAGGYLVAMPELRAMDCDDDEGAISLSLLESGFTLIGLRTYEALLVRKYLRVLPRVNQERVGLLTHSGGSSTGNLVVRLSDGFAAQVSDYFVDWRNRCTPDAHSGVHCETVPALFPLGGAVRDESSLPLPRLSVLYGFGTDPLREQIRAFFAEHLAP